MSRLILIAAACVAFIASTHREARAQEYEFGSAMTQSVAGVAVLVPSSASAVTSLPALMSLATTGAGVEFSYRQLYGLSELEDLAAQARHRLGKISVGMAINRFGESGLYQEYTITGASSALVRRNISVGAALQYSSAEFGDNQARYAGGYLAIDAAFRPVPTLLMAGAVRGLTLDRLYDEDPPDPILEVGVAWSSPSEVAVGAMWTKDQFGDHRFAIGQVLNLGHNVDFLAGLRFDPVRYSLGGRVLYSGLSVVYAYSGHPDLGATHSFGIAWSR